MTNCLKQKELNLLLKNRIDFSEQIKVVRDIITKVIVGETSGVQVCCHLTLPSTITERLGYEPQGRNSSCQTQHFPFELKIPLPPPRIIRKITKRDEWGRIVHSKTPDI